MEKQEADQLEKEKKNIPRKTSLTACKKNEAAPSFFSPNALINHLNLTSETTFTYFYFYSCSD